MEECVWAVIASMCAIAAAIVVFGMTGCTIVKENASDVKEFNYDCIVHTPEGASMESHSNMRRNESLEASEKGTDGSALGQALGAP